MAHKMPIRMSVKERAQTVVSHLLEDGPEQRCVQCEKEFHIPPKQGVSHGLCKRHMLELYGEHMGPDWVAKTEAKPESEFAPDMSQQRQQVYAP